MSGAPDIPLNDHDWEVPSYEVEVFGEKRHKYALVIPVINEGERIRGQLSRIKEAGLNVDVIVADGGSSDGSLDPDFVDPIGVRAVLTKTGPGKLSAQLRMAYAWCLRQGYAGIITIDGNGKDGVEAVADFAAKLDEGCDYVQGSRYLPGGEAENTPLERTIANRFIHAPLLSLSGRHWFTDTTNGFRAYSARYLLHPEVQPFREGFAVYNLLFYLTVRAGQLGLTVGHVPVVRRYPDDGNVPTKIGGLAPKLALLGETVSAATGGYTPDDAPRAGSMIWQALAAAFVLLALLYSVVVSPNYSPDSWALYELSKTVFSDFYRFTHFRSYASEAEYSAAFAPLWPVLIACVDQVLGTGARTGLYLAFLAFFGFAMVSEQIGRKAIGAPWIGTVIALLMLLGPSMVWNEIEAGRTIPLQLLLYALILRLLLSGKAISGLHSAGVGVLAGLALLNRFDAAFLPIFAALSVLWLTKRPSFGLAVIAAVLVTVSPWISYSLTTFGTVFATDNSSIATSLDPRAFVTDWWSEPQPSVANDPLAWVTKVIGFAGQWVINGLKLLLTPMGFALGMAAAVLGGVQTLAAKAPGEVKRGSDPVAKLMIITGFAALIMVMMAPQVLTGYLEYRYYTALFWAVFLAFICWQIALARSLAQRAAYARIASGVIALWVAAFVGVQIANVMQVPSPSLSPSPSPSPSPAQSDWASFEAPQDVSQLTHCLGDKADARVLVLGDDRFVAKAGALGGIRTMKEPRNIAEDRAGAEARGTFAQAWAVDYVLVPKDQGDDRLPDARALGFQPVADCPLNLFSKPAPSPAINAASS